MCLIEHTEILALPTTNTPEICSESGQIPGTNAFLRKAAARDHGTNDSALLRPPEGH
jgi:hypothetical protein